MDDKRASGWYPYMTLGPKAQAKIEALEVKLKKREEEKWHLLVEIAEADIYNERYVEPMEICVNRDILIEDLKAEILEKSKEAWLGPINLDTTDMRLFYSGELLKDGTSLTEYKLNKKMKYPKPFRGTIYVVNGIASPLHEQVYQYR